MEYVRPYSKFLIRYAVVVSRTVTAYGPSKITTPSTRVVIYNARMCGTVNGAISPYFVSFISFIAIIDDLIFK